MCEWTQACSNGAGRQNSFAKQKPFSFVFFFNVFVGKMKYKIPKRNVDKKKKLKSTNAFLLNI